MTVYKVELETPSGRRIETFDSALARALFLIAWRLHVTVLREWEDVAEAA